MAAKRDYKNKSLGFLLLEYSKKNYLCKGQGKDKVKPTSKIKDDIKNERLPQKLKTTSKMEDDLKNGRRPQK